VLEQKEHGSNWVLMLAALGAKAVINWSNFLVIASTT
jgi:hypothetical protein